MNTKIPVDPGKIESELLKLWEGLAKQKMRACLFNLIVFNEVNCRTNYICKIVQKVSEKYPCRVLFIVDDSKAKQSYLKTAISVVGNDNIACDYIDINVAGKDIKKVPFVILPHLIPDLPVALLWTEDPGKSHPLYAHLAKLANRIIFDSESADSLLNFSQTILNLKKDTNIDTADLNWARIEGWRELIASLFHNKEAIYKIEHVQITYNSQETDSFCHLKVQSLYLLTWLASRLNWKFKQVSPDLKFSFEEQSAQILKGSWEKLGPGTLISVNIKTKDGFYYETARLQNQNHCVSIKTSSPEKCEIPYQFILGKTAVGQSLIKEIITKGTSLHYLEMLQALQELKDQIC